MQEKEFFYLSDVTFQVQMSNLLSHGEIQSLKHGKAIGINESNQWATFLHIEITNVLAAHVKHSAVFGSALNGRVGGKQ